MTPQPMISVTDVRSSRSWYQAVLGLDSRHGGDEYEQMTFDGQLVLQLHRWRAHDHEHMGDPDAKPYGNGVLLWFQTDHIDTRFDVARSQQAEILQPLALNENANHQEFWMRDPDGYVVVVAGLHGDLGETTA